METNKQYIGEKIIRGLYSESTGEHSLADYNGDVKKILMVNTRVVPSGKFLDSDNAEFSGIVSYEIVYIDGENEITHCEFSTDYDLAVRCSQESYIDADIDTVLQNYSVRLIGPRKFSVKASLISDIRISENRELNMTGDALDGCEPEMLTKDVDVKYSLFGKSSEREYADELERLDGVISDEVEVLLSTCDVKIDSVSLTDGGVEHKGELVVSALVKCADEMPHLVKKSIPFTDIILCDGVDDSMSLETSVCILSLKCAVTPDDDGVSIAVSVITESKLRATANRNLGLVKDLFHTDRACINEVDELSYTSLVSATECCDSFACEVSKDGSGAENVRNFIVTSATPKIESTDVGSDGVKIKGEIRVSGIACEINEENSVVYTGMKFDVPFDKNVNVNCQIPDNSYVLCSADATDSSIEIDSNSLHLLCRLNVRCEVLKDSRESYVCASSLTDEVYSSDDSVVTVYYPEENETLYDIAKKYHKSLVSVASINALSEGVFSSLDAPASSLGVNKIIIR